MGRPVVSKRPVTSLALGMSGALLIFTDPAPAQDTVEEIVVTARQREETLQDVPATVQVFTAGELRRAGVERAEDFIKMTPGVSIVNTAEVADTQLNIRGINGARDAEANFAFIVDGILHTNPAAFNREYVNLKQIEILKGPQGALYGRNGAAGAIIVTTNKPGDELGGELTGSAAEDSTYVAKGVVSGPIGEELGFVLTGNWRDSDGFYHNSFLNEENVDDFENWDVSGRLLWEPSDDLSIDIRGHYGEVEAAAISFNAAFALPDVAAAFAPVLDPVFGDGFASYFAEDVNDHNFVFQANIDPKNEQTSKDFSIKVDYDMEWATVTSWFLYSDMDNDFYSDGTSGAFGFFNLEDNCLQSSTDLTLAGVTLPPPQILVPSDGSFGADPIFGPYTPTSCDGTQYQERNQEDYSVEVRVASPSDQRLRWLVGGYYLDLEREVGVNLGVDELAGVNDSLFVPQGTNNFTEALVWDDFDTNVWSVFGQLAYDILPDLEASLALRYDAEDREVSNNVPTDVTTIYVPDGGGGFPLNPGLLFFPEGLPSKHGQYNQTQPKLSLRWTANDEWTVFSSWGVGFKSGGFNNSGSAATVDLFYNVPLALDPPLIIEDEFDKEKSYAFELGFKSELLDRRLFLEGAYYHTNVNDMQFFEFLVGPFGLLRVVSNIDSVEIDGFELGAKMQVNDYIGLSVGGNYIDSEIKNNDSRPQTEGNDSPYTPEYNLNATALFDYPIRSGMDLVASVYYTLVGPTWFHTMQRDTRTTLFEFLTPGLGTGDYRDTERDSFYTLDLRVGIETDTWAVTAFGNNITDEEWLNEVIVAPEFGGSFIHPGTESRWGLEVRYSF